MSEVYRYMTALEKDGLESRAHHTPGLSGRATMRATMNLKDVGSW